MPLLNLFITSEAEPQSSDFNLNNFDVWVTTAAHTVSTYKVKIGTGDIMYSFWKDHVIVGDVLYVATWSQ